jgi:hypothetical protein
MDSQKFDEDRLTEENNSIPSGKRPFKFSISYLLSLFILGLLVFRLVSGFLPQTLGAFIQ